MPPLSFGHLPVNEGNLLGGVAHLLWMRVPPIEAPAFAGMTELECDFREVRRALLV